MPSASSDSTACSHASDRLVIAARLKKAPVCVGIDPVLDRLPQVLSRHGRPIEAIREFSRGVVHAVRDHVPAVKFQSACYERYGSQGVAVLEELVAEARAEGLQVILDAKRGDIGISAEHYASVFDRGESAPDWITVHSYLGREGIAPFIERAGAGVFALVRTSNPSSDEIQDVATAAGPTVAETVARMIASLGADHIGEEGYSAVGAVVGATMPAQAVRLRTLMPQQLFLVPGFGAQGGTVEDVRSCFRSDGSGAIVTASRSVIYTDEVGGRGGWERSVAEAAESFAHLVGQAAGWRS